MVRNYRLHNNSNEFLNNKRKYIFNCKNSIYGL